MDNISKIDVKIQEYTEKLNEKTLRKVKKGKPPQRVGIPIHLRKFYSEEISKLEKQKEVLSNQKKITTNVDWTDVIFEDYCVRFSVNKIITDRFQCSSSRKSLSFIKSYLIKRDLLPITISTIGKKIDSIENLDQLESVINILSVQDTIRKSIAKVSSKSVLDVFEQLKKVTNQSLFNFYKIRDKSVFLEYLCDIQDNTYKIIPVTELFLSNDSVNIEEDTFLFTYTRENIEYIVWESTILNRATYVFSTLKNEYERSIQIIFEYIIAERKRKRIDLKSSIKTSNNQLNCIGTVNHMEFESWKAKFNNIIQYDFPQSAPHDTCIADANQ